MADRLLTTKEVAGLLAITTAWLTKAAASGEVLAGGRRQDVDELGLWLCPGLPDARHDEGPGS